MGRGFSPRPFLIVVARNKKDPREITECEPEDYFPFGRTESRWKPATLGLCYAGIKFYYRTVLVQSWKLFSILYVEDERTLPVVLTQEEVMWILGKVSTFNNYVYFSTVYSCGLRLSEALALTVSHIDADAMLVHVRHGKGATDRTVPLSQHTLSLLRRYWLIHRHPTMVFPAVGRGQKNGHTATDHMNSASVQGAFERARKAAVSPGNMSRFMHCVIVTPHTFWRPVSTFVSSNELSDIAHWKQP